MRRSSLLLACLAAALVLPATAASQTRRAITVDDLLALHRVSDPQISPDSSRVVYTVATPDRPGNRVARNLWVVPVMGGPPRQLTFTGRDGNARWSPDGSRLAFLSSREGSQQIYLLNLTGGEPTKLTSLDGGADQIVWAPDGKSLAFTSSVWPDCADDACNKRKTEGREKDPVKARTYDGLLYRHWTTWSTGQRAHLFVVAAAGGTPKDLTPGANYDVPPVQREGPHPIAFSPDGAEIAFVAVTDAMEAISTNGDIFTVKADGGAAPARLTTNPAFDGAPAYSPDGKWIAYRAQSRPGNEADRWRLMKYDRQAKTHAEVAPAFDRSVNQLAWTPDNQTIYFNAEDSGYLPVFRVAASGGTPGVVTPSTYAAEYALSADGKTLVVARSSQQAPAELAALATTGGDMRAVTSHNAERLAQLDLPKAEHFTFSGAGGTSVRGMLLKPPLFDAAKKYPLLMVLHGGPETQFGDTWSFRWNNQTLASPGYAVLMINRRGSTGFGLQFTDDINNDWGGKAYEDLMKGLDAALASNAFIDPTRVAAAGASYGGYMIGWMASQAKGRFKTLICHAGVYDLPSMYGATEEVWFAEWSFRGTPWANPDNFLRQSPHTKAADFGTFKTPTLVIHGEQDFRVPYTQGLEFYTALQRQGVPSRLVVFPDEGHWILKPQNSAFWYYEVQAWLKKYL
jgi:dipeptidyl aminopeptidase/acylaminoacyl peptidase